MALVLDWSDFRQPSIEDYEVTDGTDSVIVDIDSDNPIGNDDWSYTNAAGGHIIAPSSFTTDPRTSVFEFDKPIENLNFEIFDVDAVGNIFQDTVQVLAFDADGNAVPVSFSDLESYHTFVDDNTIRATGAASGAYNTIGARDSITVDIEEPIVRLEVSFLRAPGTVRTGQVGIGNLTFDVVCFTPGTMILTDKGSIPVELLRIGMSVMTRDNGMQKIRWIGRKHVPSDALDLRPNLRPVLIKRGAFGPDVPSRDMRVSQQHRMLMTGYLAELSFGERELLAPAKALTENESVSVDDAQQGVEYLHLMFDAHEVICADGAWTESFHPGSFGVSALDCEACEELFELFPELRSDISSYGKSARRLLSVKEARTLAVA